MKSFLTIWTLLQIISHLNAQQRVAPGVNPQQYVIIHEILLYHFCT